jgi:hypothetical protein
MSLALELSNSAVHTKRRTSGFFDDDADPEEITFGLEWDLQSALRKDISQLEPGLRFQLTFPSLLDVSSEMLYSAIGVCGNAIWGTPV